MHRIDADLQVLTLESDKASICPRAESWRREACKVKLPLERSDELLELRLQR
jgi:hypothetical protein